MKKPGLAFWFTRLALILLIFDIVLIFTVPTDKNFGNLLLLVAYAIWLILSSVIASTWLLLYYRAFFRTWFGWIVSLLLLILTSLIVQGVLPINHPDFSLLFSILFVVSVWSVGLTTAILLWYRDVGLGLIGWALVIVIWIVVFGWHFQENSIDLLFSSLEHPDKPSPLWWFNPFACICGWIIPLGIVSFIGHTFRLILHEMRSTSKKYH